VVTQNGTTRKEWNVRTSRFSSQHDILTAQLVPWSVGTTELEQSILSFIPQLLSQTNPNVLHNYKYDYELKLSSICRSIIPDSWS